MIFKLFTCNCACCSASIQTDTQISYLSKEEFPCLNTALRSMIYFMKSSQLFFSMFKTSFSCYAYKKF